MLKFAVLLLKSWFCAVAPNLNQAAAPIPIEPLAPEQRQNWTIMHLIRQNFPMKFYFKMSQLSDFSFPRNESPLLTRYKVPLERYMKHLLFQKMSFIPQEMHAAMTFTLHSEAKFQNFENPDRLDWWTEIKCTAVLKYHDIVITTPQCTIAIDNDLLSFSQKSKVLERFLYQHMHHLTIAQPLMIHPDSRKNTKFFQDILQRIKKSLPPFPNFALKLVPIQKLNVKHYFDMIDNELQQNVSIEHFQFLFSLNPNAYKVINLKKLTLTQKIEPHFRTQLQNLIKTKIPIMHLVSFSATTEEALNWQLQELIKSQLLAFLNQILQHHYPLMNLVLQPNDLVMELHETLPVVLTPNTTVRLKLNLVITKTIQVKTTNFLLQLPLSDLEVNFYY